MVCRLALGFACLPQIVFSATPERNSFCCYDNWSFPFKVYTHNSFCVLIHLNPSSAYSGRDWRNDMYNSWGKSPQRTDENFWQECLLVSPDEHLPIPTASKSKQEARGQELGRGCCYHTDALKPKRSQSKEEIISLIFLDRTFAQVCSKWPHPMVVCLLLHHLTSFCHKDRVLCSLCASTCLLNSTESSSLLSFKYVALLKHRLHAFCHQRRMFLLSWSILVHPLAWFFISFPRENSPMTNLHIYHPSIFIPLLQKIYSIRESVTHIIKYYELFCVFFLLFVFSMQ